jgi:methylmalonyl-CoA mutase
MADATFERADLDAWREQARRDLGGRDPATLTRASLDGVELEPLAVGPAPSALALGLPGAPPFVRGSEPGRSWRVVHELAPAATLDALVARAERALREGADQLWLGPDASAVLQRPSDLDRLRALDAPVHLAPAEHATAFAAAWLTAPAQLTVVADPLGTLAERGALPTSVSRAFAHLAEVLGHAATRAPSARPMLVSGRPYHEAGVGAADELGIALATGVAYLRGLSEAGHPLADVPRRILFELATDADFFVGIAKLRAARLLWSKVLRTLGIDGPEQGLHVRARTGRRGTSLLDPHTNLLRGTAAAVGAVLGGAELVTVAPHDELAGAPSEHAEHLARTTQLLLREEAHLGQVLDPAGGSYFLESLTDRLARSAWLVLQELEHLGGVPRALADGSLAERVRTAAEQRRRAVATRTRVLVGVNRYPAPEPPSAGPSVSAPPSTVATEGPSSVRDAATGAVVTAVQAAGDVPFEALTAALGEAEPASVERLAPMREAEPFEALRARVAALADRRVQLVAVGEARELAPRVDFAREALAVGGLEIVGGTVERSAEAAREHLSDARIAVLCASDEAYESLLGELAPALRERGATQVVLATRPTEALTTAGADRFVHRGCDLVAVLEALVATLEEDRP